MPPADPILFDPILKHRAWGGDALAELGRKAPPDARGPFGESWELADLPESIQGGRTRIVGGRFDGRTLREALAADHDAIMGRAAGTQEGGFPLLIKLLDAKENLSVQVHPSAEYARAHPEAHFKSEAWIVLRAAPGAEIYRGIDPSMTRGQFAALLDADRVLDALIRVPVVAGDCIHLPSGICHALGAGIMAAEVQTPSDTTFRVWDWGRRDPARPLHRREALECLLTGRSQGLDHPATTNASTAHAIEASGLRTASLCRCEHFEIEHISTSAGRHIPGGTQRAALAGASVVDLEVVTDGQPVVWMVLEGSVGFASSAASRAPEVRAAALATILLPAASQGLVARLDPGTALLRVTLPDRMRRMLAHGV